MKKCLHDILYVAAYLVVWAAIYAALVWIAAG